MKRWKAPQARNLNFGKGSSNPELNGGEQVSDNLDKLSSSTKHGLQDRNSICFFFKESHHHMNTPNRITVVRLALTFLMIAIFSLSYIPGAADTWASEFVWGGFHTGFNWIDLTCCLLFIIAAVTDTLDGHIARSRNLITNLGKFLDPLADKFLVDSALILLATRTDFAGHHQVLAFMVVLFLGRDLAMDGLRFLAASRGKVLAANIWGKVKTAIQMAIIPELFLNGFPFSMLNITGDLDNWMSTRFEYTYIITNVLLGIALFFSLFSMGVYFAENKDVLKEEKK